MGILSVYRWTVEQYKVSSLFLTAEMTTTTYYRAVFQLQGNGDNGNAIVGPFESAQKVHRKTAAGEDGMLISPLRNTDRKGGALQKEWLITNCQDCIMFEKHQRKQSSLPLNQP
eukprot:scaffold248380_cov51-Cyclotella_meneghiniana.AAC.7